MKCVCEDLSPTVRALRQLQPTHKLMHSILLNKYSSVALLSLSLATGFGCAGSDARASASGNQLGSDANTASSTGPALAVASSSPSASSAGAPIRETASSTAATKGKDSAAADPPIAVPTI